MSFKDALTKQLRAVVSALPGLLAFAELFAGFYGLLGSAANWRLGVLGAIAVGCAFGAFAFRRGNPRILWAFLLIPVVLGAALLLAPDWVLGVHH